MGMSVLISLNDSCNLNCRMCGFSTHFTNRYMSIDDFVSLLDELKSITILGKKITNVRIDGNNEPLLSPYLCDAIIEIKKRFESASIITNGTLMTEEKSYEILKAGIDYIAVSITGMSPAVYMNFQGYGKNTEQASKQLDYVTHSVKRLVEIKKELNSTASVVISYILTEESLSEANKALLFWKQQGVNSVIFRSELDSVHKNKVMDKYVDTGHVKKYHPASECLNTITFLANGDVLPCCSDSERTGKLGNIYETPISEIFNSDRFHDFVNALRRFDIKNLPECCRTCDLLYL